MRLPSTFKTLSVVPGGATRRVKGTYSLGMKPALRPRVQLDLHRRQDGNGVADVSLCAVERRDDGCRAIECAGQKTPLQGSFSVPSPLVAHREALTRTCILSE